MTDRHARFTAIAIIALAAAAIIGFGAWRVLRGGETSVDLDRELFPIIGADLSAHNGAPDFDSLATVLDFVYLKASEGNRFRDKEFERNYTETRRTGLPAGAYHFFRFDRDGRSQADNFIDILANYPCELPPAIDIEEYGNSAQVPTALIIERLQAMPGLWICSFTNPPLARTDWLFWQHSHSARIPGVRGAVDLNTFNGNRSDWTGYLSTRTLPQP